MQTTILQFNSIENLLAFKDAIAVKNMELNFHSLTISCQCSDEEFMKAISCYSVNVLYRGTETHAARQTA